MSLHSKHCSLHLFLIICYPKYNINIWFSISSRSFFLQVLLTTSFSSIFFHLLIILDTVLLFHVTGLSNHFETQVSVVTWQTVHEHIVVDVFCCKKRPSALLVHQQEASRKWCLSKSPFSCLWWLQGGYTWEHK